MGEAQHDVVNYNIVCGVLGYPGTPNSGGNPDSPWSSSGSYWQCRQPSPDPSFSDTAEQAIEAFASIPSDDTFTQQLTEDYMLYLYWNGLEGTMQDFTGDPTITGGSQGGGFNGDCSGPQGIVWGDFGASFFGGYYTYSIICTL
jgi:hypothetical protein